MSTNHIIVGSEVCPTSKVVSLLKSTPSFHLLYDKLIDIALELNTSRDTFKKLKSDYLLNKMSLTDVVYGLLEEWVGRNGNNAILHRLIGFLETNGLKDCAESLSMVFTTNINTREHTTDKPKKFCRVPKRLEDFLRGDHRISILYTIDSEITCEKISENVAHCCFHEWKGFIDQMCSSSSSSSCRDKTKVDIVKRCSIKNLKHLVKAKQAVDNKVVFVTCEEDKEVIHKFALGERFEFYEDHMEWDDLSLAYQPEIREKLEETFSIELDGVEFDGHLLVDLINGKQVNLFKDTIPKELSYYVDRKVLTRCFISLDIFQQDAQDIFLFTGMERFELSTLAKNKMTENSSNQICQTKVKVNYVILEQPNHFEKICAKCRAPVHLLHYENGRLRWIRSRGEMTAVQKCVDRLQVELKEEDFILDYLNSDLNRAICLSDSPGMGKSVLLAQIGRRLKKSYPNRNVFFVVLGELIKHIKETGNQEDLFTAIASALKRAVCENVIAEAVLKSKLNEKSEILIELLLDGFDEVESVDSKLATDVIKTIRISFKSTRLWITSRPHMLQSLESSLNLFGFNIQPFCNDDQIQFLTSFWLQDTKQFAQYCLNFLKVKMNSKDKDIAGIPLQCLLIGEVFERDAMEYAELDIESSVAVQIDIRTITDLYQRLVEKKLEKYESTFGLEKLNKMTIMEVHVRLSVELLFPEHFGKLEHLFTPVDMNEVLKVGIVESTSTTGFPRFIHRTFAEYFIAWFVMDKLRIGASWDEELTHFVIDVVLQRKGWLYDQRFVNPVICYFINSIIAALPEVIPSAEATHHIIRKTMKSNETMQTIALACVYTDFANIFNFFQGMNAFDKHARTIFTELSLLLTIKYSCLELVKTGFIHFENHYQFGLKMQIEVLRTAVQRGEFSIVEFLIKEKGLRGIVENVKEVVNCFLHACVIGPSPPNSVITASEIKQRVQVMRMLVGINHELLEEVDLDGRTPLLSHGVDVRLRIELVHLGADIFAKDSHGDTVLHKTDFYTGQEYQLLVMHIPEETLCKLVKLKWRHGRTLLMSVATRGSNVLPETIAIFKMAGADFNHVADDGYSLLAHAIRSFVDSNRLQNLIQHGADVGWKGSNGDTLLHISAEIGNTEAILFLLTEHLLNVNAENADGATPLNSAINSDSFESGIIIYEWGGTFKNVLNSDGQSLLHQAARKGELKSIQLLTHIKSQMNMADKQGNNPLHYGVESQFRKDYFSITKLLLENDADPNFVNLLGETPFHSALKNELINLDTIQLLKSKTDVMWTPLLAHLALKAFVLIPKEPDEKIFHSLIQEFSAAGVRDSVNQKDLSGCSLLHIAAKHHNEMAIRFLVRKGADVNSPNKLGQSALHVAALKNDFGNGFKIIRYLIDHGAEVFAKDYDNLTFLHHYILSQIHPLYDSDLHIMISYLVGKDYHQSLFETKGGVEGSTPFQLAVRSEMIRQRSLALLHSSGLNFNVVDKNEASVLSYAIWGNRSRNFLKCLIHHGANWKVLDSQTRSMLHVSARYGKLKSLKFFLHFKELDVNGMDTNLNTPLHHCLLRKDKDHVLARCKLLIKCGARIDIMNKDGATPLIIAMDGNYGEDELLHILGGQLVFEE